MKSLLTSVFLLLVSSVYPQDNPQNLQLISSQFERIEIVRMPSGTDMLDGLNECIAKSNITNAVILSGIGSVTDYHYHVVITRDLPPENAYVKASVAMDLIAVQGYILNGRVHAHITLADENSVVGGHLEPGTKALTFFIITIGVLPDDLDLENLDWYKK